MTSQFKYQLDKKPKKFNCPNCGQKRFVKYVNTETGDYLPDEVGRCDREDSCGYHLTPKEFFTANPQLVIKSADSVKKQVDSDAGRPVDFLPFDIMNRSVCGHKQCNLYPYLEKLFRKDIASSLCENYFIGKNKDGDTVFWQVDIDANVRQAKVIQYDPETGRRNKETGAYFAGKKILNKEDANFKQCLFGEYLLTLPDNAGRTVAIVESEKTAIIASVYYPGFIWLATGGKHGAKWTEASVSKVLNGRRVILFPDLGAYDSWKAKGLLMAAVAGCQVAVSDILERSANDEEKIKGLDLVDYLLNNKDAS
ncbi:MAG: hypothetical protein JWM28_2745, partial [Chitinophagaceae bacterium]|nr:hypothetical protein [Chitinophagaceae bacterium]